MRAVAPLPYLYAILDSLRQESRSAADALATTQISVDRERRQKCGLYARPRNLSYSRSSSSVVVAVLVAKCEFTISGAHEKR
jgi:hypothetical protein